MHKIIASYIFQRTRNCGRIPTCITDEDDFNEIVDCSTSGRPY